MKYTDSHEWVLIQESEAIVGISRYAQEELGEIVYVELPKVGQFIRAGQEIAVLESTKAAADIYSPVTGEVIAVNEEVKKNPTLINESPEEKGWLVKLAIQKETLVKDAEGLFSPEEYERLMGATSKANK